MILPDQIQKMLFWGLWFLVVFSGAIFYTDSAFPQEDSNSVSSGKIPPPLHQAAQTGDLTLAQKLISQGTDINAQDKWGRTPLYSAVFKQHADLVAW